MKMECDISYYLPDIIVESVLREAFAVVKRNPEIIDHVFRSLTQPGEINKKYGKRELDRIKQNIEKYDWSFVHSFNLIDESVPCISMQLMSENEAREVNLEDFSADARFQLPPEELASLIVIQGFTPTAYNPLTGAVSVDDAVDLTNVQINLLFQDASGGIYVIQGGINEAPGQKQFMINANVAPNISGPCLIKSAIDFKQVTVRTTMTDVNILLGVHTRDPLLTKYFYILLKYFLMARKHVLIERGFICSKFQGSDFTRNLKIDGDSVFNRFLTLTGKVEDSFRSDVTQVFDAVNVIAQVPIDVATTEDLNLQNSTIQVGPTSQDE
jgi:hypothetical protein